MEIKITTIGAVPIAQILADDLIISNEQDALNIPLPFKNAS